mmetsp:Transcript_16810/g.24430  ORF Transcript_16810/g.24430 Transcript_16810/m.24430 type:complete len:247 (-) Transcript_16810:64-804(-)
MTSSKLSKFLTTPSRIGSILDWKRHRCTLLSIDINSERIGAAIAQHPSKSTAIHKLDPLQFNQNVARSKKIDDEIIYRLESIIKDHKVCGFVVAWPLQPDGRFGAPCGKVLHFLDVLMQKSGDFFTEERPFTLMDDRDIPRRNVDMSSMKDHAPYPDEWGRSVAFSRAPPFTNDMRYISREQCYHPTSEDSSVAASLLDTFIQSYSVDARTHGDFNGDDDFICSSSYLSHIDDFDSDCACIEASLL